MEQKYNNSLSHATLLHKGCTGKLTALLQFTHVSRKGAKKRKERKEK
jgi:hypothetical protein